MGATSELCRTGFKGYCGVELHAMHGIHGSAGQGLLVGRPHLQQMLLERMHDRDELQHILRIPATVSVLCLGLRGFNSSLGAVRLSKHLSLVEWHLHQICSRHRGITLPSHSAIYSMLWPATIRLLGLQQIHSSCWVELREGSFITQHIAELHLHPMHDLISTSCTFVHNHRAVHVVCSAGLM
jgi:hypothetical protein